LDIRGPVMGSLKNPCATYAIYRSSIDVMRKSRFLLHFGDRQTDRHTYMQTDEQMDSTDALSRFRCRERRHKKWNDAMPVAEQYTCNSAVPVKAGSHTLRVRSRPPSWILKICDAIVLLHAHIPISRSKGQRSRSPGPLMLTDIVHHIFRMARPTNFKLGVRMEDDDPHRLHAPWPPRSKVNVARSRDVYERCWPNGP